MCATGILNIGVIKQAENKLNPQNVTDAVVESLPYGEVRTIGNVRVSFHPAGHILGSAQIRIAGEDGIWVGAGDYKRAPDPTCAPFEPIACDTFVTESTFGLPIYRWDPTDVVMAEILAWWDRNRAEGRTSVLFCYTIGKVQRVLAELARATDRRVFVHGMMLSMIDAYRQNGVRLLLWSTLCFVGLTINNVLLFFDLVVFPTEIDLRYWRLSASLVGLLFLLYGFIWDTGEEKP